MAHVAQDAVLKWSFFDVFNDDYLGNVSHYSMRSTGEVSMLVIPVDFEEYPGEETTLNNIRRAFMGRDEPSSFCSVASYFDKASYGRLHLSSIIPSSFFRCPIDYQTLAAQKDATKNKRSLETIYTKALAWFQEKAGDVYARLLENSSFNKIPVSFVYTAPYSGYGGGSSDRDSMFWAFTISSPAPISWASAKMMEVSQNGCDAHTFIHETGHMFGLKDYYDTSYSSTSYSPLSPTGRADMMDCSMGEENSYSKFLLNWAAPYVPTDSCEITLRPFSGNGDFILLAPHWNGTPFDEYVLLEFYTPTFLNDVDAHLRDSDAMRLPRTCGVKAYKVDSRLGLYRSNIREAYFGKSVAIGDRRIDIANDNSSRNALLLQLLDKSSGSAGLCNYYVASDQTKDVDDNGTILHLRDAFFHEDEGFNDESFTDLRFPDGSSLPFRWKVKTMTATYATIEIEKIA